MIKKLVLLLVGAAFIGYEYIMYALTGTLVVPQQYEAVYENITLVLLVATIIIQAAIFLTRWGQFWKAAALQVMSFAAAVIADMIARDYFHNQVTAYPVWNDIMMYGVLELLLLAAIIYIWKK
ncbi:hypothetical protein V7201_16905 [Bacillus sp. JJ1122]|uniref:hypothetical protein n=1 Tax=Bacillus sp. JJ1122 TaxID=3122951 RepID=UPI0030009140